MNTQADIKFALDRAAMTVMLRPSVGQRVYVNRAVVEAGLACTVQEKDHTLLVDLPRGMGGEDTGPSPSVLLRAALSSCVAMGVKMWAARREVAVDRVEVIVETDVDARGQFGVADIVAPGFEGVRIHIKVASPAPEEAVRDVVDLSLKYSPLIDAFRKAQVLETQVSIGQPVPEDC